MVGGTEKARWCAPDGAAAAWLRNDDVMVRLTDATGWELAGTASSRASARTAIRRRHAGPWQPVALGISKGGGANGEGGGPAIPEDVRLDSSTWDGCGEFMGYMLRRQTDTIPQHRKIRAGGHPSAGVSAARVLAYARRYAALGHDVRHGQSSPTPSLFHSPLTDAEVLDAALTADDAAFAAAGVGRAAVLEALAEDSTVTENDDDDDDD